MDWIKLNRAVGPLRYQMSECDCVPTTIVNALLVVRKRQLKPKLLHLIWSVSLDFNKEGTGFVSSQLLAHVLQSWFDRALLDGYESRSPQLISEIIEGKDVHLDSNNSIARCLNAGGVACLTTENGRHYSLLISRKGNDYFGFDPWWSKSYGSTDHSNEFGDFCGMINIKWTHSQLLKLLKRKSNKWVHLIYPSTQ